MILDPVHFYEKLSRSKQKICTAKKIIFNDFGKFGSDYKINDFFSANITYCNIKITYKLSKLLK